MKLLDRRLPDGSRHFARLSIAPWAVVRDHVRLLQEAEVLNFVDDRAAMAWLDFSFRGHRFLIHNHGIHFHLSVRDPQCSDLILYHVGRHFEQLVETSGRKPWTGDIY